MKKVSIFWFRRDLRVDDNKGFFEALNSNSEVLPLFIFDKNRIFIFDNIGAYNPKGVLSEFLNCIEELKLNKAKIVRYSKIIADHLYYEENLNYGSIVK